MRKQIGYRLEIWYKNWEDKEIQKRLEKTINKILKDFELDHCTISFKQHDASKW